MIKCSETGVELTASSKVFALGRRGDVHRFPISAEVVNKVIPKKIRNPKKVEEYRTGGINFYHAQIVGQNGSSELQAYEFAFSVPLAHVDLIKKATEFNFNFPDREIKCGLGKFR